MNIDKLVSAAEKLVAANKEWNKDSTLFPSSELLQAMEEIEDALNGY